jgi:hypothetical protein
MSASHCPRQMQTLNIKTGTELGYDVENQQACAVVRQGESVNYLGYLRLVGKRYVCFDDLSSA